VALGLVGAGNAKAAAVAERAVAEFSPAALLFVGVAGGLRDWLRLGDVVLATKVYAYHGGRAEDDGVRSRPQAWEPSYRLMELARSLARAGIWAGPNLTENSPRVHFEPVASGEVVLDSKTSVVTRWLYDHYNDAVAVEMESAGFGLACHLNDDLPAICVRGISDHAGGEKNATDEVGWQVVAARNAAAFAEAVVVEISDTDVVADRMGARDPARRENNHYNVATGNARVGRMIGAVYGDIHSEWRRGDPE
jgi:adenosylhomocysteine nucleosidase